MFACAKKQHPRAHLDWGGCRCWGVSVSPTEAVSASASAWQWLSGIVLQAGIKSCTDATLWVLPPVWISHLELLLPRK